MVTQDAYFSLLRHTKQLLLVTLCEMPAGTEIIFRTDRRTETVGQTDVEVEIVM